MKKTCLVYALYSTIDYRIRYVGQTVVSLERRLRQHLQPARFRKTKTHRNFWLKKNIDDGFTIGIKLLEQNAEWNISERRWIRRLKRHGFCLVNSTGGGEGSMGATPELRARISESVRRVWQSPEMREAYRASRRGKPWSDARRDASVRNREVLRETHRIAAAKIPVEVKKRRSQIAAKALWDKKRTNGTDCGIYCNSAKLNEAEVILIRSRIADGTTVADVAREFDMSRAAIRKVRDRETWKHVA